MLQGAGADKTILSLAQGDPPHYWPSGIWLRQLVRHRVDGAVAGAPSLSVLVVTELPPCYTLKVAAAAVCTLPSSGSRCSSSASSWIVVPALAATRLRCAAPSGVGSPQ